MKLRRRAGMAIASSPRCSPPPSSCAKICGASGEACRRSAIAPADHFDVMVVMDDGAHAQALDAAFIHHFGTAGPLDEAMTRLREIREMDVDFMRIIPGSRDMAPGVGAQSMQGLAKARATLQAEVFA